VRGSVGVLAMAYGTAAGPEDVERFYTEIRGGRPPSPEAVAELRARYEAIGNRFPLAEITMAQARGLEEELKRVRPGGFRVYVGMKHSPPFIPNAVARMRENGVERAVGLVLAPHYSRLSVGTYVERVLAAVGESPGGPPFTFVEHWHDHPPFVAFLASRVRDALARLPDGVRNRAAVVFTAHSLPARIVEEGDPYPRQLEETARLVAERLGLSHARTAWQSAGRTSEPWLGPDVAEAIRGLAEEGFRGVVVCPCGFVADHLEVLYDLDVEAAAVARDVGLAFVRTESPNADPAFLKALAGVVLAHLGEPVRTEGGTRR
jgi:ferrochelatase